MEPRHRTPQLRRSPKASWLGVKKDILSSLPDWTKPTPYEVKSNAVRDACLAVSAVKKFNKKLKANKEKGLATADS